MRNKYHINLRRESLTGFPEVKRRYGETMVNIYSFPALRPIKEKAEAVACVPYDVVTAKEARESAIAAVTPCPYITAPNAE